MRENMGLFKGKRIDDGEWVYGMLDTLLLKMEGICTIAYFDYEGFYCEDKVDPETVCECTGLKDKNGKLIFEGDIVRHGYSNKNGDFFENGSVAFVENDGAWEIVGVEIHTKRLTRITIVERSIEIIGNVFDNPELLNTHDNPV